LFANVQGSGTVAVLKNVAGKELAVFNNSSRFRSSTAVARIVRAGPIFAGTSAKAGEGALVTADADMVGGVGGGGGGWTEASDRAAAITVAAAAAADDDDANRERVTGGAGAEAAARVGYGARATRGERWIARLMAGRGRAAVTATGAAAKT
jgi:hypothetical protein